MQRPFLRDSAELARRLEPVAEQIEVSLPVTGSALRTGTPVLTKAPPFYRRTREVFRSLDELTANPNTLLALRDLHSTVQVTTPLLEHVAPYQTVCNYWNYYWTAISEHVSEEVRGGTTQRTNLKSDNRTQDNRLSDTTGDRPVDTPAGPGPDHRPRARRATRGRRCTGPPTSRRSTPRATPTARSARAATCAARPPPATATAATRTAAATWSWTATCPGLAGGTFKSRELGIDNLKDVP